MVPVTALRLAYGSIMSRFRDMLTLAEALKTDRLREFIAQEEARGVGPASSQKDRRRNQTPRHYTAEIRRSNIAFDIARWFARKVNSFR